MSPKHKLITTVWCAATMIATLTLSHGHLIVREIMMHWPVSDSWEGRLESALYTQGGLFFVSSLVIGGVILLRSYFSRTQREHLARRELSQRDRHERAAAARHDAMMSALAGRSADIDETVASENLAKKRSTSGAKPR
ncbi:MAG: hypothetical protein AAF456_03340 [Planctomycetota bacterium]